MGIQKYSLDTLNYAYLKVSLTPLFLSNKLDINISIDENKGYFNLLNEKSSARDIILSKLGYISAQIYKEGTTAAILSAIYGLQLDNEFVYVYFHRIIRL